MERWHLHLGDPAIETYFLSTDNITEMRSGVILIPGSMGCCVTFARRQERVPRWRLVCPECDGMVNALYAPDGLEGFANGMHGDLQCRACVGITYEQTRGSHLASTGDRC